MPRKTILSTIVLLLLFLQLGYAPRREKPKAPPGQSLHEQIEDFNGWIEALAKQAKEINQASGGHPLGDPTCIPISLTPSAPNASLQVRSDDLGYETRTFSLKVRSNPNGSSSAGCPLVSYNFRLYVQSFYFDAAGKKVTVHEEEVPPSNKVKNLEFKDVPANQEATQSQDVVFDLGELYKFYQDNTKYNVEVYAKVVEAHEGGKSYDTVVSPPLRVEDTSAKPDSAK